MLLTSEKSSLKMQSTFQGLVFLLLIHMFQTTLQITGHWEQHGWCLLHFDTVLSVSGIEMIWHGQLIREMRVNQGGSMAKREKTYWKVMIQWGDMSEDHTTHWHNSRCKIQSVFRPEKYTHNFTCVAVAPSCVNAAWMTNLFTGSDLK